MFKRKVGQLAREIIAMQKQLSRQETFELIQKLQRELADGAWENVNLSHQYSILNKKHAAFRDFVFGNRLEIVVGMSMGPDNPQFISGKIVESLREEFKKMDEQPED
jgi:hypothetical protein